MTQSTNVNRIALQYLVIQGLVGCLGLASYLVFSRLVLPASYAQYALIIATAAAVNAFLYSWIGISLNRYFQDPRVDQTRYVSSIVVTFAAISAGVVLIQLLIFALWPQPIPTLIWIACPVVTVLWAWFELSLQLARARMQVANYGIKTVLRATLLLGVGTALALAGWGAIGLLIALAIGLLAGGLSALSKDLKGIDVRSASFAPLRDLYAYGWPLALCLGLSWIVGMSDRYLVYWLIGEEAAGEYALAYGFAQMPIWLALTATSRATLPLAARAYESGGETAARDVLAQSLGLMLLVCLPVVALEVLAARQLTSLFLGAAYAEAGAQIMPIVAVATLLQGLRGFHLDIAVHLAKRTRLLIGLWGLAAGTNVLLNLILIPRLGIVGAAWSTLIAHVVAVAYFVLCIPRPDVLGLPAIDLIKIASAILVFAVLLAPVRAYLDGAWFFVGAGIASLLYASLCWLLNPTNVRAALHHARAPVRA